MVSMGIRPGWLLLLLLLLLWWLLSLLLLLWLSLLWWCCGADFGIWQGGCGCSRCAVEVVMGWRWLLVTLLMLVDAEGQRRSYKGSCAGCAGLCRRRVTWHCGCCAGEQKMRLAAAAGLVRGWCGCGRTGR
ncbi:hypothetical protein BC831DRAFT_474902 [Entophlyctis helioformis]|nr:hypothetical protein BC831DRAFT_474902 [Entophlyctis helioformis]